MSHAAARTLSVGEAEPLVLRARAQPGVALLTLNRPAARNALSLATIGALHAAIEELGRDANTAAIVIAANGPVFSSGHDLKEMTAHRADADKGLAFYTEAMSACAAMMQAIVACPKPVIAAVEGTATAAGCQLVATCDLAIASDAAQFCTPGVNIGLFCSTPMVALSRNIARKRAMQMLLTGDMISAAEAADWGLVNRAVATGEALPDALRIAAGIAEKSPLTVAIGKAAFYAQAEMPLKDAYDYAATVMVENMMARDAEEGIGAFLAKRKPEWKGR
jgi:enoyl-CoA hydratase/carnithine racemase